MGYYSEYVLPRATHFICGQKSLERQRRRVVPQARGEVLEIGVGSGLNLPFYDPAKVERIWGLDPNAGMWKLADARNLQFDVEYLQAPAETIPLGDGLADTIVVTYSLCSVAGVNQALTEMRRVLKPGGTLLFCEHGAAPQKSVRRWQERLNPIWKKLTAGCSLNLPVPALLEKAGFRIRALETAFIGGPRFASFNYWGRAD